MHQFDEYIGTVIKELNVSKKQKAELGEEFRDHLESLKLEYMEGGMNEQAAVSRAIKTFGCDRELTKRLNQSMTNFRTKHNIMFGLFYLMFVVALWAISIKLTPAIVYPSEDTMRLLGLGLLSLLFTAVLGSWIAYFTPIIYTKAVKFKHVALINVIILDLLNLVNLIYMMKSTHADYHILFQPNVALFGQLLFSWILVPLCSTALGFGLLKMIDGKILGARRVA